MVEFNSLGKNIFEVSHNLIDVIQDHRESRGRISKVKSTYMVFLNPLRFGSKQFDIPSKTSMVDADDAIKAFLCWKNLNDSLFGYKRLVLPSVVTPHFLRNPIPKLLHQIIFSGLVTDLDDEDNAAEVDFDSIDYRVLENAIISPDRIRIEWEENCEHWAITIYYHGNENGQYGIGQFECRYDSWEDGRRRKIIETGEVNAEFIAYDVKSPIHELDEFWIDVHWRGDYDSGRLLVELTRDSLVP